MISTTQVIVQLQGGIGNQLFQYACARSLSIRSGAELVIDSQTGFSKDKKYKRTYALLPLRLAGRTATHSEMLLPWRSAQKRALRLVDSYRAPTHRIYRKDRQDLSELSLFSAELPPKIWLEGVWASERYFVDHADKIFLDVIRNEDDVLDRNTKRVLQEENRVAIHFRFFSDISQFAADDISRTYYDNCIELIRHKISNPKFFVFSDNLERAADYMRTKDVNWSFASDLNLANSDLSELLMMSCCRHLIASNSTFSWWATWLGERRYQERIALVPDPRIFNSKHWSLPHLLPERWTKI